jgi:hypothetical protein
MSFMPIDLAQVDWLYVLVLTVLACIASGLGNLLSFGSRGMGTLLTALAFAALFVGWTYYPHGLPLPTSLSSKTPATTAAPPPPPPIQPAPARPRNPVTDVTPPPAR